MLLVIRSVVDRPCSRTCTCNRTRLKQLKLFILYSRALRSEGSIRKRGCPVYVEWEGVVGRRARANLLHKAVPLPRAAHKIALGGAAQPLSANVSAIAFAAPAQLKRRLGGPRAPAAPGAPPAEPAPSTSGAAAAPAPEDAAPTNGAVRRRAPDTLPMEVT
ncbi:hypothetical protein HW555_010781 [Spodoptera exigua]|uniref:Uncharacterized protein n=1 Tax=Spodoptera exigua TaxID=7107 RepID=A0A835G6H7_SPOEX|nr:hypothetical protein HW555_010781 [Spodoptera exigua]